MHLSGRICASLDLQSDRSQAQYACSEATHTKMPDDNTVTNQAPELNEDDYATAREHSNNPET
jgi:hypothetical protein